MKSLYPEFKNKPYLEQWERVGRWYKKLMEVKHGSLKEYSDKELLDVVYVYFMNIQHLKDWVINSNQNLKESVMKLQEEYCFIICSDFINNHKHFERGKTARYQDKESAIKHQHVTITAGTGRFALSQTAEIEASVLNELDIKLSKGSLYKWDIVHKEEKHDAYELAKTCYEKWLAFIKENKLME